MGIWELPGARFSLIKFGKGLHYFYKCDTILSRKNICVCCTDRKGKIKCLPGCLLYSLNKEKGYGR